MNQTLPRLRLAFDLLKIRTHVVFYFNLFTGYLICCVTINDPPPSRESVISGGIQAGIADPYRNIWVISSARSQLSYSEPYNCDGTISFSPVI